MRLPADRVEKVSQGASATRCPGSQSHKVAQPPRSAQNPAPPRSRPRRQPGTAGASEIISAQHLRQAEREAGFVAVVIIGPPQRVARYIGDNEGAWPVKVGITQNPRDYMRTEDRGWQEVTLLACVWTNGIRFAERLKAAVERMIAAKSDALRRSWHDLEPEIAELTLAFAAEQEEIEVFDWDERQRRLAAAVEKAVKAFRMRR